MRHGRLGGGWFGGLAARRVLRADALAVFRRAEDAIDRLFQDPKLLAQRGTPRLGEELDQVHQRRVKTLADLDAVGPVMPDLRERKPDKVVPRRRGEEQPSGAGGVGQAA